MVRTSFVVTCFCWFIGTASISLAQSGPGNCGSGNCDTGACGTSRDGGCGSSDGATVFQKSQAKMDLHKQQAELIRERNDAWPKPFQCFDRQAFHGVFAVMTQRGWQCECTLTSDHFDSTTHELNIAGKSKINGIMSNLPEVARQVHVYQDSTYAIAETQLASVRKEVQDKYSFLPPPELALTTFKPHGMSGALVEDVQKRFVEGLPAPKVPAAKASTISTQ